MPELDDSESAESPERSDSLAKRRALSAKLGAASAGLFGLTLLGMVYVADRYGTAFGDRWGALWILLAAIGSFAAGGAVLLWNPPRRDTMMVIPYLAVAAVAIVIVVAIFLLLTPSAK
jgi:peptidoglycan/LPS O-acetylase OafA/YrhL